MCEKKLSGIKISILTLGCKVNAYESDAMAALLKSEGAEMVDSIDPADVYIINTCSVTNIADRKSRQMLHRVRKMSENSIIIAAGCYIQALSEKEREELNVDGVCGNNLKKDIVSVVTECLEKRKAEKESEENNLKENTLCGKVIDISKDFEYEEFDESECASNTRAYLKIQDGCNQFCSYCIIPYTRGRIRSRKPCDVISEAKTLSDAGYKEIVLTGIHLSSYTAYGEKGGNALILLLNELSEIDGIKRIRLGSLEPRVVTHEFADKISKIEKLCPQFHLSLQSGSDTVLKRMNRKYVTAEYIAGCDELRRVYDNPAITTDIIVGFPGETEAEFSETVEFAKKVNFSRIHIFKYSRRRGTVADKMPGQIEEKVKSERSDILSKAEEKMAYDYAASFMGKTQNVLLEEEEKIDGVTYLTGYSERYVRCAVKNLDYKENMIVRVRGKEIKNNILICDERME